LPLLFHYTGLCRDARNDSGQKVMFTNDPDFHRAADRFLAQLLDTCDAHLPDGCHADLNGGVLTIDTPAGQYVLNKHGPNRQLWLSSPRSGAWHFEWRTDAWVATRNAVMLQAILRDELGLIF
jgi:frataxin